MLRGHRFVERNGGVGVEWRALADEGVEGKHFDVVVQEGEDL